MTIVFVIENAGNPSNGSVMTALRFRKELERQGHVVRIVSDGITGDGTYSLESYKIPFISKLMRKSGMTFAKYNKKIVSQAFQGADIIHLFFPFELQRRSLKLARKMGIICTAAFHLHPDNVLKNAGLRKPKTSTKMLFQYFRKYLYDHVTDIHCPSHFIADELVKHNYKARLHVISNGITNEFKHVERNRPKVDRENPFRILMVGRLAHEKRQDLLIDAIAESKYADMIDVTFAGSGPLQVELETRAKKLSRPATFDFFTQDKLLDEIHRSDLYVHAADVEIEGISCIEAFASGLVPLIGNATDSATKQFALIDESLFNAGDAENLRKKIEYWIENPEHLKTAGKQYATHAKNYTIESSVKKFIQMCELANKVDIL